MKQIYILLSVLLFSCEKQETNNERTQSPQDNPISHAGNYLGFDNNSGGTSYVTATLWDSAGVTWYWSHGNDLYPDTFEIQFNGDSITIPNYFFYLPSGALKYIHGFGLVKHDTLSIYYQVDYHNTGNDHLVFGTMNLVKQ